MESINYMLWREVVLGRLTQIKKDTSADTTQTSQWQIELFSQELCFLFSVRIQSSVKTREDTMTLKPYIIITARCITSLLS